MPASGRASDRCSPVVLFIGFPGNREGRVDLIIRRVPVAIVWVAERDAVFVRGNHRVCVTFVKFELHFLTADRGLYESFTMFIKITLG